MTTLGAAASDSHLGPPAPDISDKPLGSYPSPPLNGATPTNDKNNHHQDMSAQSEILNATDPHPYSAPAVDGYFRPSHAAYSSHSPASTKLNSLLSDSSDDVPLSMRFMHKPLRSGDQLRKASDPTRRNSLINAHIDDSNLNECSSPNHLRLASMDGAPYRLVRKKLGEIVKSLLKEGCSTHRSKSLPSTPSFKLVHFGSDADIRYFSKKDRPTAILAQNSPALGPEDDDISGDDDEDEDYLARAQKEFDYFDDELNSHAESFTPSSGPQKASGITKYPAPHHGRLIDWDVNVTNFPTTLLHDRITSIRPPVFLERVFVSIDKRFLLGHIAVSNITYEKSVTVRYTLDNWATIVEIPTIYVPDIPASLRKHNYDRFVFKIPLDSMFNSFHMGDESNFLFSREHQKIYHLCIRYSLPGHEFWDNNGGKDYLIKIKKTIRSSEQLAGPDFVSDDKKKQTPRLRGGGLVLPKTARSKPEAHSQRPKYSSHYMKRFHSEPNLNAPKSESKKENKSNDHNDFENNNFYLSSPLFTSIKNNRSDALCEDQDNLKDASLQRDLLNARLKDNKKEFSNIPRDLASREDIPTDSSSTAGSPSPMEGILPSRPLHGSPAVNGFSDGFDSLMDLKSYKELLESYCFFTTPSQHLCPNSPQHHENLSHVDPKDTGPDRSLDPDNAFTVSSFLRK